MNPRAGLDRKLAGSVIGGEHENNAGACSADRRGVLLKIKDIG
jgi:hypothetical protein